jgi:hypothetical protein
VKTREVPRRLLTKAGNERKPPAEALAAMACPTCGRQLQWTGSAWACWHYHTKLIPEDIMEERLSASLAGVRTRWKAAGVLDHVRRQQEFDNSG